MPFVDGHASQSVHVVADLFGAHEHSHQIEPDRGVTDGEVCCETRWQERGDGAYESAQCGYLVGLFDGGSGEFHQTQVVEVSARFAFVSEDRTPVAESLFGQAMSACESQ